MNSNILSCLVFGTLSMVPHGLEATTESSKARAIDTFNYVIGTQTFGSKYQFTVAPRLLETAREIEALGSNLIKFRLGPRFAEDNYAGDKPGKYRSLKDLARSEPTIREVLEMPFAYYFMWANAMESCDWRDGDAYTERDATIEYRELYDLTRFLLQTYAGTGKRFYLGNWEGDWLLLGHYDRAADPDPKHVEAMIAWQNNRQRAIDDAKRDTPHEGVEIYHYLELVLVEKGLRGRPCVATEVLPKVNVDYVSYSAYEMQTDHHLPSAMARVLGFLEAQLQPKAGIEGRRVFVGEFGYQGKTEGAVMQLERSLEFMRAALEWGSPFILQWQLYGNENQEGRFRGYWLIDDEGRKWPLHAALKDYFAEARAWVEAYREREGNEPPPRIFAHAASRLLAGACAESMEKDGDNTGFESGTLEGWRVPGFGASVATAHPRSGRYHVQLEADGTPEQWAAASLEKPAASGESWEASVHAWRVTGPLTKLKLAFYDAEERLLRVHEVTSVEPAYQPLKLRAKAPKGTAEVHLVLALEFGTEEDPARAYFDDAQLVRIEP